MGRAPCCSKLGLHRGPWTPKEDASLTQYIQTHGEGNWRNLPKVAGLLRCGKGCRLRWLNYLRPDIKRGNIGSMEEDLIIRLHSLLGNRWSLIAGRLPGRTDNEIKNHWNSHLSKKFNIQRENPKAKRFQQKFNRGLSSKMQDKNKERTADIIYTDKITTRNKIYTPKPVKIRTILANSCDIETNDEGLDRMVSTTISEYEVDSNVDHYGIDWPNLEHSLFTEQESQSHVLECDLPLQDNLFGRLYLEYSQLLNSDEERLQKKIIPKSSVSENL